MSTCGEGVGYRYRWEVLLKECDWQHSDRSRMYVFASYGLLGWVLKTSGSLLHPDRFHRRRFPYPAALERQDQDWE